MPESRLFMWSRLVREAHRHVNGESGLMYARAFTDPKQLVDDLYGKRKPILKQAAEKIIDWAEKIRGMPDSGSFSSKRRAERRRRAKG